MCTSRGLNAGTGPCCVIVTLGAGAPIIPEKCPGCIGLNIRCLLPGWADKSSVNQLFNSLIIILKCINGGSC